MKKLIIIFCLSYFSLIGQSEFLDEYIRHGLQNNLALKQKQFLLDKSVTELKEARGLFYPSIGINARYTRAGGGRVIDIPIGDLVNPIHFGLNSLNPGFNYPTNIPNGITRFLRREEHETKLSLLMPVIQASLFYNHSIKSNLVEIKSSEKKAFSRVLICDIKIAYYNYLKTLKIKKLYAQTYDLVSENLRVTESLYRNDKVTIDFVYRARAEVSEIDQKQLEADNNVDIATSYFNFLLNKPLDSKILTDSVIFSSKDIPALEELERSAILNRDEMHQVKLAIETAGDTKGLSKTSFFPGISFAADYGFQGEEYRFGKDDDFWMASLVLNWNLFNGFRDLSKTEKAEIEIKNLNTKVEELKDLIKLQTKEAYKNYQVASKTINATEERLKGYKKSFGIMKKKFAEGLASQLEYLDAQNRLTQAEVTKIVSEYNLLQSHSELEKITASIDLTKYGSEKK